MRLSPEIEKLAGGADHNDCPTCARRTFLGQGIGALGLLGLNSLLNPRLGFHVPRFEDAAYKAEVGTRLSSTGIAAARRKFTPEFINRFDNIIVFRSLGNQELRRIVDIELETVQERIRAAAPNKPFLINVTGSAKEFLLLEGTDHRYGARPLKRAIERLLVQPLSNLMATGQIHRGDYIRVSHSEDSPCLMFSRETETLQGWGVEGRAAA